MLGQNIPSQCYSKEEEKGHKSLGSGHEAKELALAVLSEVVEEESDHRVEQDEGDGNMSRYDVFCFKLSSEHAAYYQEHEDSFEQQ